MGIAYEVVKWLYIDNLYIGIIVSQCANDSFPFHGCAKVLRCMENAVYR